LLTSIAGTPGGSGAVVRAAGSAGFVTTVAPGLTTTGVAFACGSTTGSGAGLAAAGLGFAVGLGSGVSATATAPEADAGNHSRMDSTKPGETVAMWFLTLSGATPSSTHLAMMSLDSTPSSFANSKIRLAKRVLQLPPPPPQPTFTTNHRNFFTACDACRYQDF
jgi:hypothetical protein